MRIWDIHPGYLNRQRLLGEHRELHGIVSIIVNRKKGYSNHPDTLLGGLRLGAAAAPLAAGRGNVVERLYRQIPC